MPNPLLTIKTKKAKVAFVREKLASDDAWLLRGLVAIYRCQTNVEKNERKTVDHNGVGFGAFDADFLTGMAERALEGVYFTPNQIAAIRKAMLKYAGQLVRLSRTT